MSESSELWQFTCEFYSLDGVEEACLHLQNSGWNIPLLLFCCWAGKYCGELDKTVLSEASEFCRSYSAITTEPLRSIRQRMKAIYSFDGLVSESQWNNLREDIKSIELKSEQVLLSALESLAPQGSLRKKEGAPMKVMGNIFECFNPVPTESSIKAFERILSKLFADISPEQINALLTRQLFD